MLHKLQLPNAEYQDLRRIFHFQICLLLWILCKSGEIEFEQATIIQKFGPKAGKWLSGRIWWGGEITKFGNKISSLMELVGTNTEQAKSAADYIWNDIQFHKRWDSPDYGMKFPMLQEEWKKAIHDICIPFYENWFRGAGFKKNDFGISGDYINRAKLMQAFRSNGTGVCSYCDGALGDVGSTKEANDCEHFFPQSKFPHLCLHPRNLFASCKGCNETWKIDKAPMGGGDPAGLYGTYHPDLRPGIGGVSVNVNEEPDRKYKITLMDDNVAERVVSLNAVLDIDSRWTNDINERLRANLSELIAESVRVCRKHGAIDQEEVEDILSSIIAYREEKIGKSIRTVREIAVLKYQKAHQIGALLSEIA